MKRAPAKLFEMLPRVFTVRIDFVGSKFAGADCLNREGKTCGLDAEYPGFAKSLQSLIDTGHVMHVADEQEGTEEKGRLIRHFVSLYAKKETAS